MLYEYVMDGATASTELRRDRASCGIMYATMRMPRFLPQSSATGFDLGSRRARASKGTRIPTVSHRHSVTDLLWLSFSILRPDIRVRFVALSCYSYE